MLRPLKNRIVVQPLERKVSEIIFINDAEKFNLGRIVAVGPKATDLKVGDVIRFGESRKDTAISFQSYNEDGIDYLVMSDMDVCFVEEVNGHDLAPKAVESIY